MIDRSIINARWYINSEDGYEYLIDLKTSEILAKRGKDKKLIPLPTLEK